MNAEYWFADARTWCRVGDQVGIAIRRPADTPNRALGMLIALARAFVRPAANSPTTVPDMTIPLEAKHVRYIAQVAHKVGMADQRCCEWRQGPSTAAIMERAALELLAREPMACATGPGAAVKDVLGQH